MEVLKREAAPAPLLRRETVDVAPLGAAVIVRGRTLPEEMLLSAAQAKPLAPLEGETEQEAHTRNGARIVATALHLQVVLEDDTPLWSRDQWLTWGAQHPGDTLALYRAAQRLSGAEKEDVEKN